MSALRRFISSWQGAAAGLVALVIYFSLPSLYQSFDLTAGSIPPAFGAGLIHFIGVAALIYFSGIWLIWAGWQIAFKSLDRLYDGDIEKLYRQIPPWLAVLMIQGSFVFMALFWMWAMRMAWKIVS